MLLYLFPLKAPKYITYMEEHFKNNVLGKVECRKDEIGLWREQDQGRCWGRREQQVPLYSICEDSQVIQVRFSGS